MSTSVIVAVQSKKMLTDTGLMWVLPNTSAISACLPCHESLITVTAWVGVDEVSPLCFRILARKICSCSFAADRFFFCMHCAFKWRFTNVNVVFLLRVSCFCERSTT